MKTRCFFLVLLILTLLQQYSGIQAQDTLEYYWVSFSDKNGTPYEIGRPSKYLSQRALERRRAQCIAIDSTDLPVSPRYTQALTESGARIHNVSKWLNGACVIADSAIADSISRLPFVTEVYRCLRRNMTGDTARSYKAGENMPTTKCDVYDQNYYGLGYTHIELSNGIALHRRGYQGQGVWIGVCDGGFPGVDTLSVFKSLRDEHRLIATRDFMLHRPSVYYAESHGTMVLSNMAANIPGLYVGTAPKASYILCITEDGRSESPVEEINWAAAAEYLDSMGVDVINTSLGYNGFGDTSLSHKSKDFDGKTALMTRAAEAAAAKGIICVVSAGNSGGSAKHPIGIPADAEHSLTVGAAWSNGDVVKFSSWGPTADGRIKPDVMGQGVLTYVASPSGGYLQANGTSFASPITAGMVACLRGAIPLASVMQICAAIRLSGNNAATVDNHIGFGVPNFDDALNMLIRANTTQRPEILDYDAMMKATGLDKDMILLDDDITPIYITGGYMGDDSDKIDEDNSEKKQPAKTKRHGKKHHKKRKK